MAIPLFPGRPVCHHHGQREGSRAGDHRPPPPICQCFLVRVPDSTRPPGWVPAACGRVAAERLRLAGHAGRSLFLSSQIR